MVERGREFLTALLVAAFGVVRHPKAGLRRLHAAVRLGIKSFARGQYVERELAKRRLHCCQVCPLFHSGRKTCGNPLDPKHSDLGCGCYMPVKVKFNDATCWMDDALGEEADHSWKKAGVQ